MRRLVLLSSIVACINVCADEWKDPATGYTWSYKVKGGETATIYNSDGKHSVVAISPLPKGALTIPSRLGGKPVGSIGYSAFSGCHDLTSVTIPNSVNEIQGCVFWECHGLTNITIPATVTHIMAYAFKHCSGLTKVTIPDAVDYVATGAFEGCTSLEYVTLPSSLKEIDGGAFKDCQKLRRIMISDSVRKIESEAFKGCTVLSNVTLGASVQSIGRHAFHGCAGLRSVEFTGDAPTLGTPKRVGRIAGARSTDDAPTLGKDVFPVGTCKVILPEGNSTYAVVNGEWMGMKVEWRKKSSPVPAFVTRRELRGPLTVNLAPYDFECKSAPIAAIDMDVADESGVAEAIEELERVSDSLALSTGGDDAAARLAELRNVVSRYQKASKASDEDVLNSCLCLLYTKVYGRMSNDDAKAKVKAEIQSLRSRAEHGEEYVFQYSREAKLARLPARPDSLVGLFSSVRIPAAWEKKSANASNGEKEAFKQAFIKSTAIPMLKADCALIDAANKLVMADSRAEAGKWLARIDSIVKELKRISCLSVGQYAHSPLQKMLNASRIADEQARFLEEIAEMAGSQEVSAVIKGKAEACVKSAAADFVKAQKLCAPAKPASHGNAKLYMVIDISGGVGARKYPISYLSSAPKDGWTDEYKTRKIVLRCIEPGSFTMGSSYWEVGRDEYYDQAETQHKVTITKPFYIGVFEVTQKQYELVTGSTPSAAKGDMRPVENIGWNTLRGDPSIYNWPATAEVDPSTFMGILRAKTGMSTFDLPTEAQWEYACRAGTTTALNNGKNLTNTYMDRSMDDVGRYGYNNGYQPGGWEVGGKSVVDGRGGCPSDHTTVGSYLPNAWGLYDMHGNVSEWCLDLWLKEMKSDFVKDPVGPDVVGCTDRRRVLRGGNYSKPAANQRSASRYSFDSHYSRGCRNYDEFGFRLCYFTELPIKDVKQNK